MDEENRSGSKSSNKLQSSLRAITIATTTVVHHQVNRQILKEEEEKAKIQKDLSILTDRLSKINESLARKVQARNEYDRTVQETEARTTVL